MTTLREVLFSQDPVRVAQRLLMAAGGGSANLAAAIAAISADQLWAKRSKSNGEAFKNIAEFVSTSLPDGLGVTTVAAAGQLREALSTHNKIRQWVEIIEGAKRPRGRPPKNSANGDNSAVLFKISGSATARDQLLLRLKREAPEQYEQVCDGTITAYRGAIISGLIADRRKGRLRFGAVDFNAASRLSTKAKCQLLGEMFEVLGLEAQCAMIAAKLDGRIGVGLAAEWRNRAAPDEEDHSTVIITGGNNL